ncbi:MAG: DUF167 domain-containing protein [Candidatus Omnitrophota bacterium]|nr:DUF167 domain-containing protein [Candidatus Omnitrophota bacterium]MDZ4241601.1 DUF167 domain-containing protein [Candidatus Omnitrophota bacterium]
MSTQPSPSQTFEVKVVPNARRNLVRQEEGRYKVYLSAPALDGRANAALVEVLAEHFGVKKSRIEIIKGLQSRNKTIKMFPN